MLILENADPSTSGINENLEFPSPTRTSCSVLQCLPMLPGREQLWTGAGVPGAAHSAAQCPGQASGIPGLL